MMWQMKSFMISYNPTSQLKEPQLEFLATWIISESFLLNILD